MLVWTKQHENVKAILEKQGRFTAKKEFVLQNEEALLMLPAYDWLVAHHPAPRPRDADYPIWLSFRPDAVMLPTPGFLTLTLDIPPEQITRLNIMKWTAVNNLAYIPTDPQDAKRHKALLSAYRISDAQACTSQFYPDIRREVEESWLRTFDDSVSLGNDLCYGLVWELRKEWMKTEE